MLRRLILASLIGLWPSAVFAEPQASLTPLVEGLEHPVYLTHDGTPRLYVVEQAGRIRVIERGRLLLAAFLDIRGQVESGGEMGLLSAAFHPDYAANGRFFVNYTARKDGQLRTIIAEYRRDDAAPRRALPRERVLLEIVQPFANHNGGQLAFGPDGYLYIGMGDGGGAGDPTRQGQNLRSLLGKILRIDVNAAQGYRIPKDNPFADGPAPEIWAYGLRNPWRFSFDRATGRMLAGDVGQNHYEEVDVIEPGGNYGWNHMEGMHCYPPPAAVCATAGMTLPIAEYPRSDGISVTGGYVYRGQALPKLDGVYVFGDYGSGTVWGLRETGENAWQRETLLQSPQPISSFGEDAAGELYIVGYDGTIYRLDPPVSQPN